MKILTEKYIFECKLKGKPVMIHTGSLYHKDILKMLVKTGIWKKDPIFTDKFWREYSFTILYPIRLTDEDLDKLPTDWIYLGIGDHHTVCL